MLATILLVLNAYILVSCVYRAYQVNSSFSNMLDILCIGLASHTLMTAFGL